MNTMLRCPCGFKSTDKRVFRSHVKNCSAANRRMVQHRTEVNDDDMFVLFDAFDSQDDSVAQNAPDDQNTFSGGGGAGGGGGASGDWGSSDDSSSSFSSSDDSSSSDSGSGD